MGQLKVVTFSHEKEKILGEIFYLFAKTCLVFGQSEDDTLAFVS